jgi:hypothetical protein
VALVKPDQRSHRQGYRPEIDGLRALAVIAVILNHTRSEWLPSGYLGVDIFFVISGFVITSSLLARGREGASEFFLGFMPGVSSASCLPWFSLYSSPVRRLPISPLGAPQSEQA